MSRRRQLRRRTAHAPEAGDAQQDGADELRAAHAGCSRKVDVVLDPAVHTNTLKLNVSGTVSGKARRDTDNFRYR